MTAGRYPFTRQVRKLCSILGVAEMTALAAAGLPIDLLDKPGEGLPGPQLIDLWEAVFSLARENGTLLDGAQRAARSFFKPALLAFSCSPDIETGLHRLAEFKPLVSPVALNVRRQRGDLVTDVTCTASGRKITGTAAIFDLVFIIEQMRVSSACQIVPAAVELPDPGPERLPLEAFLGVEITIGPVLRIHLSQADATAPLVSENKALWTVYEKELRREVERLQPSQPASARVKAALLDLLPAGEPTVEAVCGKILLSRRSLQRHLAREGRSFQSLLDETREEMALRYLQDTEISVSEVSYLLAYNNPNSFHRAFRGWTGMTPTQMRAQLLSC